MRPLSALRNTRAFSDHVVVAAMAAVALGLCPPAWGQQTEWNVCQPPGRFSHAMAYDSSRGVTVLFSGSAGFPDLYSDTWEWNGATWTRCTPANSPPARYGHAMAYDSARGVTVLFGGRDSGAFLDDTWEWNGVNWTQCSPETSPSARYYHAMTYDSARGVTVLFGGSTGTHQSDTWEWNGATWAQRSPATSPQARSEHAISYDSARGVTLLFGGITGNYPYTYLGDTWEWNGTNWAQRSPATNPLTRCDHAVVYDCVRNVTILFGGFRRTYEDVFLNDTWEWNGETWAQRDPATKPSARSELAMIYDSARGVTVLFGGTTTDHHFHDTWTWNGATWAQQAVPPLARRSHAIAYDSGRSVTVLFGGYGGSYLGDTWEWNGASWMQRSCTSSPQARSNQAMAYDSSRSVIVLYGGYSSVGPYYMSDTWEWDGTNWTQRTPTTRPSARAYHSLAYDSARGVTVMFGGMTASGQVGDTWEWNGTTWTQRSPATSPPVRYFHAMAYDSTRGVTVLFGGYDGSYLDDTWEWNGTTWTQRTVDWAPVGRSRHAMAYDRGRGLTVLFGGTTLPGPIYWDDTWEWDGATWSARTTANIPHARENHAVAYDSSRGVTVLFGGDYYGGQQPLDDTWEYGIHVPDGDLDESGSADGRDIAPFVAAVIAGSTDPTALYHADFSGNGVIDLDDVPGFVQKLVGP